MRRTWTAMVMTTLLVAVSGLSLPVNAATPFHSLPEETVLAIEAPSLQKALDAVRANTRLGAEVLTKERFEKVFEFMKQEGDEDFKEMEEDLGKYGMKPEDFFKLADGPMGFALLIERRPGAKPLFVGVSWMSPGQDVSERGLKAVLGRLEDEREEAGDEAPADLPRRVDLQLAGKKVHQFTMAEVRKPVPDGFWDVPEDIWEKSDEEQDKFWKERDEEYARMKEVQVDQTNVLVAQVGGSVVVVNTFPQVGSEMAEKLSENPNLRIDFDEKTGLERAKGVMARLLTAMDADRSSGFVARMQAVRGMADAMPEGVPLVEAYVDADPLLALADNPDDPAVKKVLEGLGIDGVKALGMKMSIDGRMMKQGLFVSAPSPRRGLLKQLDDTKALSPEPAAWVPANVLSYTHASLDLGAMYNVVTQVVQQHFPQAQQGFAMAEMMLRMQAGVGVGELLSAMGDRHTVVQFPPVIKEDANIDRGEMPFETRMAMVWQPKNNDVFARLFNMMKQQSAQAPADSPVKFVDQLGFTGIKVDQPEQKMGFFQGQGYLTMMLGGDTIDTVLSLLRKGKSEDSLLASDIYRRSRSLITARPGLFYSLSDADRGMEMAIKILEIAVEKGMDGGPMAVPEMEEWGDEGSSSGGGWGHANAEEQKRKKEVMERFRKLLPSKEEMKGLFGVQVGQAYMTQNGLVMETVSEMAGN